MDPDTATYALRKIDLKELESLNKGVCRIEVSGRSSGTGIHWGSGWVLTNSHVIQEMDKNNPNKEPNVDMKNLTFYFETLDVHFEGRDRLAILFPLEDHLPDLAFVKLGLQAEYQGRPEKMSWEIEEQEKVSKMNSFCCNLTPMAYDVNHSKAFVIHHGNASCDRSLQFSFPSALTQVTTREIVHGAHTRPGSSGSPVFDTNTRNLVGLSFGGDDFDDTINRAVNLCYSMNSEEPAAAHLMEAMRCLMSKIDQMVAVANTVRSEQQIEEPNDNQIILPLKRLRDVLNADIEQIRDDQSIHAFIPLMFIRDDE